MLKSLEKLPGNMAVTNKMTSSRQSLVLLTKTQGSLIESKILNLAESIVEEAPRTTTVGKCEVTLHSLRCKKFEEERKKKKTNKKVDKRLRFREKRVSMIASLDFQGKVASALREKLRWMITKNKTENIFDIYQKSEESDKEVLPILGELNKFAMMVLKHYFGEEELFECDDSSIDEIKKSIFGVNPKVKKKIEEIKTDIFSKSDLHSKFMLLKIIFKIISESPKEKTQFVQNIKMFYYLRNPTVTDLVEELYEKCVDQTLLASTKNNADFVFEYIYKKRQSWVNG